MERIGDEVGYGPATIANVLAGRVAPAWHLVRKLGVLLRVPAATIMEEWHPLWTAADHARRTAADAGPEPSADPAGHTCDRCGSWVVDVRRHAEWHLRLEEPSTGRTAESLEWQHLRDAVSRRKEP
jgi:hypothetical protein